MKGQLNDTHKSDGSTSKDLVSIKQLTDFLPLKVNWLKVLRSYVSFEIDENYQIYLSRPDFVKDIFQLFDSMDDRLFANIFHTGLLLDFTKIYSVYFESVFEKEQWGLGKARQRFEQCITTVRVQLPVAFTSLLVKRFTNKRMIDDAQMLANRTMKIIINDVEKDKSLPFKDKQHLLQKLRSMKLILGYPEELLVLQSVEDVYKDLNLTGTENFLNLVIETFIFSKKQQFKYFIKIDNLGLERDEATRWIDYTTEDEYETPLYDPDAENVLCEFSISQSYQLDIRIYVYLIFILSDYPSLWFQQPYFHHNRPRYYKDTLFPAFLSYSVMSGLRDYMEVKNLTSRNENKNHFDFIKLIYENYATWDDVQNKDQPLPGFLFTNKQLFWLSLIHKNCIKLQRGN